MAAFEFTARADPGLPPVDGVRVLYHEHAAALSAGLRRLAGRCEVDDLLQEVFVVALRRAPALLAADSPRAWLYGVALRVAGAARRRERIRQFFNLGAVLETPGDADPSLDLERRQTVDQVHAALGKLSAKKREVLVLFELEGLSGQEIAQALDCPLKTVWTRLHHGRRELEAHLLALRATDGGAP